MQIVALWYLLGSLLFYRHANKYNTLLGNRESRLLGILIVHTKEWWCFLWNLHALELATKTSFLETYSPEHLQPFECLVLIVDSLVSSVRYLLHRLPRNNMRERHSLESFQFQIFLSHPNPNISWLRGHRFDQRPVRSFQWRSPQYRLIAYPESLHVVLN